MKIKKEIDNYLSYIETIKNVSKGTIKVYKGVLYAYKKNKYPLNEAGLFRFIDDIKQQSPATKARKITIIKAFLNYLYDKGKIKNKYWEGLKAPRYAQIPKYLTEKEIKNILENSKDPYKSIFEFIYKTGLRVSEIYKIEDIQKINQNTYYLTVNGKGNKQRSLSIDKKVYNLYNSFKDNIPAVRSIQRHIKQAAEKAEIKKSVTVHKLRHSLAVKLINNKTPLNVIQSILGHSNLSTTGIYTKVSSNYFKLN